jgi:hypothetical protein
LRRAPLRPGGPGPRRRPLRPGRGPARRTPLRRSASAPRTARLSASAEQRAKVAGRPCLVCGSIARIDPAHVVPRSLGGCDAADCVLALCRRHHRAYDTGELDLLPYLEPRHRPELAHAVAHLGLVGTLRRVTGRREPALDLPGRAA